MGGRTGVDVDALARRLAAEQDVVAAYLFGSRATGQAGAMSDVDVAALLEEDAPTAGRTASLVSVVGDVVGSQTADVVILNDAPVAVAYRVLRDGVLLVDRDPVARVRHWVDTVDRYLDMAPMRETLAEGTRQRIREGRFGRS